MKGKSPLIFDSVKKRDRAEIDPDPENKPVGFDQATQWRNRPEAVAVEMVCLGEPLRARTKSRDGMGRVQAANRTWGLADHLGDAPGARWCV